MPVDRDRQRAGSTENIACAACNRSGQPIRNALCPECEEVHWFCPECGRILDRDSDPVCICGFEQARLENRLLEIEQKEARQRAETEAMLVAETKLWHRRFGRGFVLAGVALLVVGGALRAFTAAGAAAIVVLGVGALLAGYGLFKRFHLGA
jgi:hypothetical protein